MIAYLDASALSTLLLRDAGGDWLDRWVADRGGSPVVSDFCFGETVSAIGIRHRRGLLAREEAETLLHDIGALTADWRRASVETADIARAIDLVARFDLALRLPDAIHIAIARRLDATLITADKQQARAAAVVSLPVIDFLEGPPTA